MAEWRFQLLASLLRRPRVASRYGGHPMKPLAAFQREVKLGCMMTPPKAVIFTGALGRTRAVGSQA